MLREIPDQVGNDIKGFNRKFSLSIWLNTYLLITNKPPSHIF